MKVRPISPARFKPKFDIDTGLHPKQAEVFLDPTRFRVVVAGRRWGKCLAAGTKVSMADGSERSVEDVKAGDQVLTLNESTYAIEPRPVLHVHDNGVKETVRLSTSSHSIVCTPNHPFLVNNAWVNAGDIRPGDLVAVPKKLAFGTKRIDAHKLDSAYSDARLSSGSKDKYLPIPYEEFVKHLAYDPQEKGKCGGHNSVFARNLPDALREGLNGWRKQSRHRVTTSRYEALRGFSDGYFNPIADADVEWEEVISVEPAGEAQTYDLTVCGNHNFVAEGLVTHNTNLSKNEILARARIPKQKIWYIAPTYRMAKQIMWNDLKETIPRDWIVRLHETEMSVTLANGTIIECKGADNPDTLRGVGLNFVVMDEFQDMRVETWTTIIRPTLAKDRGEALFIGCVNEKTKVLGRNGVKAIESFSIGSSAKTLDPLDVELYGLNRDFHKADGFWNNGVVETRKIKTHMGFELESSLPHPVWTIDANGVENWKKTEEIAVGDRIAIARDMEVWGNVDPMGGWAAHAAVFRASFAGKRGPKPTELVDDE